MFYKVIKNSRVIDVLDQLVYMKYQPKHRIMVLTTEDDAQCILSSDKKHIWHVSDLYRVPVDGYDTVELCEIDQYEFEQLKAMNYKTPQELLDAYTLQLLNEGVIK